MINELARVRDEALMFLAVQVWLEAITEDKAVELYKNMEQTTSGNNLVEVAQAVMPIFETLAERVTKYVPPTN